MVDSLLSWVAPTCDPSGSTNVMEHGYGLFGWSVTAPSGELCHGTWAKAYVSWFLDERELHEAGFTEQ